MKLCDFDFGSITVKKVSIMLNYVEVAKGTVAEVIRQVETLGDYWITEAVYDYDEFVIVLESNLYN